MIVIPFDRSDKQQSFLIIVLEKDNLDRMKKADPVTLETTANGGVLPLVKYPADLHILIAYEEDAALIYQMMQEGRTGDIIGHILRGYEFKGIDGHWSHPGKA